jgi:hypothetical protein
MSVRGSARSSRLHHARHLPRRSRAASLADPERSASSWSTSLPRALSRGARPPRCCARSRPISPRAPQPTAPRLPDSGGVKAGGPRAPGSVIPSYTRGTWPSLGVAQPRWLTAAVTSQIEHASAVNAHPLRSCTLRRRSANWYCRGREQGAPFRLRRRATGISRGREAGCPLPLKPPRLDAPPPSGARLPHPSRRGALAAPLRRSARAAEAPCASGRATARRFAPECTRLRP